MQLQRKSMLSAAKLTVLTLLMLPLLTLQAAGAHVQETSVDKSGILERYAGDTWESFQAMVFTETGLPTDNISADTNERAGYTSPTNIGAYIWSTLTARDLQIIDPSEARARIGQTLDTLQNMERHADSGMYYNWYDPATGDKLTVWPPSGDPVYPF